MATPELRRFQDAQLASYALMLNREIVKLGDPTTVSGQFKRTRKKALLFQILVDLGLRDPR